MSKKIKNPLIAGLLNAVLPGAVHLYLDRDWSKFALSFVGGGIGITIAVLVGLGIQSTKNFILPQGLVPGGLVLVVMVIMFFNGRTTAEEHNHGVDGMARYKARRAYFTRPLSAKAQRDKNQQLRDEGLISKKEYDKNKEDIAEEEAKHSSG